MLILDSAVEIQGTFKYFEQPDEFQHNHRDRFSPGSTAAQFKMGNLRHGQSRCFWKSFLACIVYCGIRVKW